MAQIWVAQLRDFQYRGLIVTCTNNFLKEKIMGLCQCGYSTDPEKNCNGTHKVVAAVKADVATKLAENGFTEASDYLKSN